MSGNKDNNINNINNVNSVNGANNNYNQLPKKEQENVSAQKAGELGARVAADAVTGGEYEKIRNAPVVGNLAKKAENKAGKKIAKADKRTGGNIGKISKPLNDSGAIDTANKGMNVLGGGKPTGNNKVNPKTIGNSQPNIQSSSMPNAPANNTQIPNNNLVNQNFAKNGLNNDNQVPNGNSEGANQSRLRNVFDRKKKNGIGSKLNPFSKKDKSGPTDPGQELVEMMAQGVKRFIKMAMLPLLPFLAISLFIFLIFAADSGSQSDMHAVDKKDECYVNNENKSEEEIKQSCEEYYSDSKEQKEFYERVNKTVEDYKSKGKDISSLYISATYFILHSENKDVTYETMTQKVINSLADGMLGGNSSYSEETFRKFLVDEFIKKYIENKSKEEYEKIADDIFAYVKEYLESQDYEEEKCTTTTGSSCKYVFNGVHGLNSEKIDLSNIQVRMMSSSDCPGGKDNVVLDEPLVPFEEYVLGVGYGELGPNYNIEVAKVHLIAARSFALARPYYNRGAMGVKLIQESNKNIIQLRSCVSDQVFCNTKTGCSSDYDLKTCKCQPMIYSGATSHKYTYQESLSNYPNSNLEKAWKETMGMVAVDKDGKVVLMPYALNNSREDPQDPRVWLKWAQSGKNYKAIILAAYPQIEQIKQANCSDTTESDGSAFLRVAKEIWTEITNTFGDYSNFNTIPPNKKEIDCSSFVDWVLYKYGYEDFGGAQRRTEWFVNTDLHAKYGWEEIRFSAGEDVTSKLKPGDIIVRDPGNNDGHMAIVSEVRSDGTVWGYDCGGSDHWQNNKGGKQYNFSWFVKTDRRPGKIIRVTNNGTGDTCETAESGEWSEWRQDGPAPWKNIPLGKSGRTIGSHGCYVTSIAIQIARSGVKTSLPNFNPGTFVTELNKSSNSFDEYGNFNGIGNVNKMVPGFKTVANHASIGNTKQSQIETIQKYIDQGYYVILNVDNGGHWVAVTGTTKDNIQMVDPARTEKNVYDAYSVSSCIGITVFDIK